MYSAVRYEMTKPRLLRLLEDLKAASGQTSSFCIPPNFSKTNIESLLRTVRDLEQLPEDISKLVAESPTGGVLFWGLDHRYLVIPPFPIYEERVSGVCEIEPLHTLLHKDYLLALVLIRLGAYSIGIFQGEKLISSKVGTGLVHARHRQGGSSAHRFERHREKQMEAFFTRVCIHVREQLEPHTRNVNFVLYGGTKETILDFRKQCRFLREFNNRTLDRLLNVRDPRRAGLSEGIQEAWSSRVIRWDRD
jgi:hypothetical protein